MGRFAHHASVLTALVAVFVSGVKPGHAHGDSSEIDRGIRIETLARSTRQWDGTRLPAYPVNQPEIQILKITIPAGATLPLHSHPVINAGFILQGALEVQLKDGPSRVIRTGEALIEVVNTVHSGRALPGTDVEIVVFYAGTPGKPLTLLKRF